MFQLPLGKLMVAGVIGAFISIASLILSPDILGPAADIRIEPSNGTFEIGETFTIAIVVESKTPVNVFSGLVTFNPETLIVDGIDYNTSIADLWAVLPWYDNGEGTLKFAGGTTREGGFVGKDTLITITFKTVKEGVGALSLTDARILKHDGLGTDVDLEAPIDALFTVAPEEIESKTVVKKDTTGGLVRVIPQSRSFDLNNDGLNTFADVSIFMIHLSEQNLRSDFNQDGTVNIVDANLILSRGNK